MSGAPKTSLGDDRRIGRVASWAVGLVLLAWGLTVDFPKATGGGFFSDGATYYSLAHSLAEDFDFEYRREDLVRVWREYQSGPEGIFLKRGRDVQGVTWTGAFPYVALSTTADPDTSRLYYGKAFIFPLFAAPFVWLFGTNGFLVLHAVLMTACFVCAYRFLALRSAPLPAVVFALAFLFVSVAPVYMAWLTPDFFNLSMVLIAYYFWACKEARRDQPSDASGNRGGRWTEGIRSDVVAAIFLGFATFSKPTHLLLMLPILALFVLRRQWIRGLVVGCVFAAVTGGFFAWNTAISGEWNYQGGEDRATFYSLDPDGPGPRLGGFPLQTDQHDFSTTGMPRETNRVLVEVLTSGDAVLRVFTRNLGYFFIGRHTGFVPFFFPGALAIVLFLSGARRRPAWQWLTFAGGIGSAIALLLYMPYTYSGGGGPVGNRYFLGVYPVFLFIVPPLASTASGLVALAGGALFTAQLLVNPFYVSTHPGEHTKRGLYRWLPAELSLLNDLPVNVSPSRSKQPLGGTPPITGYFLDDNAYNREGPDNAFWVKGGARAELLVRSPIVTEVDTSGAERVRALQLLQLEVVLESGAVPTRVTVASGADEQVIEVPAHDRRSIMLAMPAGLPYKPFPELPTNYVYSLAIASENGFIPMFSGGGRDARLLGIFVRLIPHYD